VNEASTCPAGHRAGHVVRDGVSVFHGQTRDRYRCELPDGSFHRFLDDRGQRVAKAGTAPRRSHALSPAVSRHYSVGDPAPAADALAAVPTARRGEAGLNSTALLVEPARETVQTAERPAGYSAVGSIPAPRRTDTTFAALPVAAAPETSDSDTVVPSPPTDEEKYWYLDSHGRWLIWVATAAGALVIVSLINFALNNPLTWIFLGIVLIRVAVTIVAMATTTRRRRYDRLDHENRVATWRPAQGAHPSVDVFLPSAGEPLEVLANTYLHVSRMEWAGELAVHVLDDSARVEVRALASRFGFTYHSRPDRGVMKKAGNLKYGYEHSTGDFIAVFDADFVPRPEYLSELVPYFDDESVAIVQSPQFFDTDRKFNWLQRAAGATQEYFYRIVQPSRDAANAAICVGTCALYRRSALQESGGFAQIGHSEDVHTGVNLLKVGYYVRYVPVVVSKGLSPDSLSGFVNQQYRWCAGSMSLLVDRRFHAAPLTLAQRACFFSGFLYYISTAIMVFTEVLPTVIMLWLYPEQIAVSNYRLLLPAFVLSLTLTPMMMRCRWKRGEVLRVQMLYSFAHALAIIHVLRGRTADWVPTGAAGKGTPLAVKIRRMMVVTIVISQVLLWGGIAITLPVIGWEPMWPLLVLAVGSVWIQVPALFPLGTSRSDARPAQQPVAAQSVAYPPAVPEAMALPA
jgi:cellulose synthase/poly-beta-1,6-N-acetylglucosamine synthase-like glycosyltransferase